VIGSVLIVIVAALFFGLPHWMRITGILLALIDTGGIHWFIGSLAWHSMVKG
jgi:hypothetical protein